MVKVNFAGYDYEVNSIITLGTITFDVTKANDLSMPLTNESELARLYLDTLPRPERVVNYLNNEIIIPAKKGIDLETATAEEIITYINDDIKKSPSIKSVCRRVLALKFKPEFEAIINKQSPDFKKEYRLTLLDERKDIDFLGECGFNDTVNFNKKLIHDKRIIGL